MQVIKTFYKSISATQSLDQRRMVARHKERVQPGTAFVRFMALIIQVTRIEIVQWRTEDWILVVSA
jgi:hypothetical protein